MNENSNGPTTTAKMEMDEEDRTPVPAGYNAALWRKADEVFNDMALVADDTKCLKILYEALVQAPAPHVTGRWLPIAQADRAITNIQEFPVAGMTLRNSDRYWVRDEDGRTYEASWTECNNGRDYWWDWEGESPVDPVEFMPHPLDPRWASATEGSENGR